MDDDVRSLADAGRLIEAAELAITRKDHRGASELFERACAWRRASEEALRGGDPARALSLAVLGGETRVAESLLGVVAKEKAAATKLVDALSRRGDHLWAAKLAASLDLRREAAREFERAGMTVEAAHFHDSAGDPSAAGRLLEGRVRSCPADAQARLALGHLLARYAKWEPVVRAVQPIPESALERRDAVALLARAYQALGMAVALGETERELARHGGALGEGARGAEPLEATSLLFGRYRLVREVAQTPSSRVYECVDGISQERVALKVFAGEGARGTGRDALLRFEREVRALVALEDKGVVPFREWLPEGPAIVTAWMPGGTLADLLERGPVAPARALEIALAVLVALGEAHRLGVLHRDVKPANVLFDAAGGARLADFGVAHLSDSSSTATAGVIGTAAYMSPEQRQGRAATVQADLYGAGAMLYEMLTGEPPSRDDAGELRRRPSGSHRELGPHHDAAVARLVESDPRDRPESTFAARRELTALSWPATVEGALRRPTAPASTAAEERVEATADGRLRDRFAGRAIERVAFDPAASANVRAFARAGHPALQTVYRVDLENRVAWLESLEEAPAAVLLRDDDREELGDALRALHAVGFVHSRLDRHHVRVRRSGSPVIRLPETREPSGSPELDLLALSRL